jgi:DNA-binding CsgD family transcriptional regulator
MNSDNATADRLRKLNCYLAEKNKRLDALLQLFAQDPSLPIEVMVREYSAALDEAGICTMPDEGRQNLGPRQRSGITKRQRNREKLIAAGVEMLLAGKTNEAFFAKSIAEIAGISEASFYHHFGSKNGLLAAAYDSLLQPILNPTTEGS